MFKISSHLIFTNWRLFGLESRCPSVRGYLDSSKKKKRNAISSGRYIPLVTHHIHHLHFKLYHRHPFYPPPPHRLYITFWYIDKSIFSRDIFFYNFFPVSFGIRNTFFDRCDSQFLAKFCIIKVSRQIM